MKKVNQILCLITCLLVFAAAAIHRDGRVFGHHIEKSTIEQADTSSRSCLITLEDGTIVVNTTDIGKDILGYGGPVPLEIHIKDNKILDIKALANDESPDFFNNASELFSLWKGKTLEEASQMQVDAISGATMSSNAIIGNVNRGIGEVMQQSLKNPHFDFSGLSAKNIVGLIIVLMAAIIPLIYKNKKYRIIQLILNVIVLGFWCGTFLSYSMFVNFVSNGMNIWTSLIPFIMLLCAFVYPLFGKSQYYCTNICPFGSMQELAGKVNKRHKLKMSPKTIKALNNFRIILWATLTLLMMVGIGLEWMDYELFTAFIFESASAVVIALAIVVVLLSLFIQRPYCRFVCPTGSLFKYSQGI